MSLKGSIPFTRMINEFKGEKNRSMGNITCEGI